MVSAKALDFLERQVTALLSERWHAAISNAEIASLASDLTKLTRDFQKRHRMHPPMAHCRCCRTTRPTKWSALSGHDVIGAATDAGLIGKRDARRFQAAWKHYEDEQRAGSPGTAPDRASERQ